MIIDIIYSNYKSI